MAKTKNSRLLAEERRRKILQMIGKEGQVTITGLAHQFRVSAVTVRADLDALSKHGMVMRSHGGALKRQDSTDYPLQLKAPLHRPEKVRIGHAAAELVRPNETIILDSGTTTAEVAAHLKLLNIRPLTVITHALNIALELSDAPGVSVIVVGGLLRPVSHSMVGPQAEAMLSSLHADRFFLAVDGLDLEAGPSTPDVLEAQLNSSMARVAKEIVIVADSSKLGRQSVTRIGPIKIDRLVTDRRAPADFVESLRKRGVQVTLV